MLTQQFVLVSFFLHPKGIVEISDHICGETLLYVSSNTSNCFRLSLCGHKVTKSQSARSCRLFSYSLLRPHKEGVLSIDPLHTYCKLLRWPLLVHFRTLPSCRLAVALTVTLVVTST